jgi:peptidyl-prolyl cis-trans isomerase C
MRLFCRLVRLVRVVGVLGFPLAALAQPLAAPKASPAASVPAAAAPAPDANDPVVASVDGHQILLSEVGKAVQSLPPAMRDLPFEKLYPVLLDRLIDHQAVVMLARRSGLETDPTVRQQITASTDRILEGAYLAQVADPKVTEAAIEARYDKLYAHRPITEEVRARHILVATEAEARAIIADLKRGADFVTTARIASKDADAERGGDLGFFRRDQVWPGLADAAFSLAPGQVGPDPLHNEFGWHVIKVEEKRSVAPPSLAQARDQIRQDLLVEAVQQAIDQARQQLVIRRYNVDGTVLATTPVNEAEVVRPSH